MILGYDAPRLHAALNDLPAALLLVAVLFDLAAWLLKRESLRWAGIWTLWAGVIGGWAAVIAGELAEESLEHGEAIHDLMERHEQLALITMGIFTVVLVGKLYRRFNLRPAEEWAARALSVVGVAGILWVAVIGGKLVFEHAAGLKSAVMEAEMRDRGAGHEHEPVAGRFHQCLVEATIGLSHAEDVVFLDQPGKLGAGFIHRLEALRRVQAKMDDALDRAPFEHDADFQDFKNVFIGQIGNKVSRFRTPLDEAFRFKPGEGLAKRGSVHAKSLRPLSFPQSLAIRDLLEDQQAAKAMIGSFPQRAVFRGGY